MSLKNTLVLHLVASYPSALSLEPFVDYTHTAVGLTDVTLQEK